MDDMAEATSEAASIAAQYGVEIEQLSALTAVAVSKTRESGSEVGNALKAIFVNLQDTTSKPIQEALAGVDISMTKIENGIERLKTPVELLQELSVAFTSLEEGSALRANILNDIGGKYHANTLSAILSDWSAYEEMLQLYASGEGSAMSEAQKSANNLSGSLNKLRNTWTDIVQDVADSDALRDAVNLLNNLLETVNNLTGALGTGSSISLLMGLITSLRGIGKTKVCGNSYCAHPYKIMQYAA